MSTPPLSWWSRGVHIIQQIILRPRQNKDHNIQGISTYPSAEQQLRRIIGDDVELHLFSVLCCCCLPRPADGTGMISPLYTAVLLLHKNFLLRVKTREIAVWKKTKNGLANPGGCTATSPGGVIVTCEAFFGENSHSTRVVKTAERRHTAAAAATTERSDRHTMARRRTRAMAPQTLLAAVCLTVAALSSSVEAFSDPHNKFCGEDECYTVLGLHRGADKADIKKAYRTISLGVHPDKNPSEEARVKFTVRSLFSPQQQCSGCCRVRLGPSGREHPHAFVRKIMSRLLPRVSPYHYSSRYHQRSEWCMCSVMGPAAAVLVVGCCVLSVAPLKACPFPNTPDLGTVFVFPWLSIEMKCRENLA